MNGHDLRYQPKWPEGFPVRMIVYDNFSGERDWHPRMVDDLELDELFWLPIVRKARLVAIEQLTPKD